MNIVSMPYRTIFKNYSGLQRVVRNNEHYKLEKLFL